LAAHDFFPFGKAGTERYTRDLAHALGRQGHHVRILAPRADLPEKQACFLQEEIAEGIAVGRLHVPVSAMAAPRVESMIPAVADFLGRHSFDVVHLQHFMGLGPVLVDLVKQRGIPLVATANDFFSACEQIHLMLPTGLPCVGPETVDKCVQCAQVRYGLKEEQIPDQFFRIADRRLTFKRMIAKLDLLVCPSQFLKRIYEQYGFIAPRTVHLPQGADLRPPLPRSPRNDQNIVVTYLGHIAYRKGLDLLVRAFNEADTDRAELRIFGINSEPRYFQQVMASIRPGKRVTYGGEYTADQMPGILAQTDVAVVPSRGENYPFVIREILHHRVPVVAASVAGVPEIVHDGVNGRLFPPGDHDKLRSILQEILAGPDTLDRWRAGITPIRSMDEDAREIELLYADLLADRAQRDSINIVQVRPTPQSPIASSAGRLLAGAFTEAGLATTTSVNRMSAADAHLFIGFDAVESTDGMKHVHKIAFQHEPLKLSDRIPGSTLVERLRRAQEVWTFIADDAHWLAEQGIAARTLPLGSAGPRINAGNLDRDLDVLVLSAVGPMHEVILKQLEHFCEVTRVKNAPDGILRDLFRRTKIVLALADPAASSLDLLRVVEAWSAGALVVTDTTSPVDLSGPLVQVESAVLAQLVWRLLSDTDLAHEQHQKVEAWLAERRLGDALRTWLREPAQMIQLNFAATL
jgi:glycosyltransferase involved in cell wall biosynthesis